MGERGQMTDLMAWNADGRACPIACTQSTLRHLSLENDLAEGRCLVDGKPAALTDIRAPMFVAGTTRDHVAPWRSVYKIHLLTDTEITFLLTTGGHNAGMLSEPGRNDRKYQVRTTGSTDPYSDPDTWTASAPHKDGSWWPQWDLWLNERSSEPMRPPPMGAPDAGYSPLGDAPGAYVLQE